MIERKDLWLQEAEKEDFDLYQKWVKIGQDGQKNGNYLAATLARMMLEGNGVGFDKINEVLPIA
jgi:hypothetical protein